MESWSQRRPFASFVSRRTRSVVGRKSLRNCGRTFTTIEDLDGLECAASFVQRITPAFGYIAGAALAEAAVCTCCDAVNSTAAKRPSRDARTTSIDPFMGRPYNVVWFLGIEKSPEVGISGEEPAPLLGAPAPNSVSR